MCRMSPHSPRAEASRTPERVGFLVYDGSRTIKALGGQGAGHTNKPKNQKTNQMCRMPSPPSLPPPPGRTRGLLKGLAFWFMMARGPSKPWEARELAIPINQKTRKPIKCAECRPTPPPSPGPNPRTPESVGFLVYWFMMARGP